jgi:hypothetical protein
VNVEPKLCRQVLEGAAFEWIAPAPEEIPPAVLGLVQTDFAHFNGVATVDVDQSGTPERVGYFSIASGAGPGCAVDGIALLDGSNVEDSARNRSLLSAQEKSQNCRGSNAFLIRVGDAVLIEIDGGDAYQRPVPPRSLLRMKGDNVETICRTDQQATYISRPVSPK